MAIDIYRFFGDLCNKENNQIGDDLEGNNCEDQQLEGNMALLNGDDVYTYIVIIILHMTVHLATLCFI